ncbi:hypothetical protein MPSEU_000523800 [Mayamaea pseudoterrestris]|nr:hypothetical protein MPSEU_000523800 [Mayamaea pseudoterrestris]
MGRAANSVALTVVKGLQRGSQRRKLTGIWPVGNGMCSFDKHFYFHDDDMPHADQFVFEMKVTTERIGSGDDLSREAMTRKRMLLYKHDDDLRQEAFATQFVAVCGSMLRVSGFDMKLLSFQCVPVGTRRGFVEWVPGSVPLSEICHPMVGSTCLGENEWPDVSDMKFPSMLSKGVTKYVSLRRLGGQQNGTFRRLSGRQHGGDAGSFSNNPVQDYLRSVAYDDKAPYMIRKVVILHT